MSLDKLPSARITPEEGNGIKAYKILPVPDNPEKGCYTNNQLEVAIQIINTIANTVINVTDTN